MLRRIDSSIEIVAQYKYDPPVPFSKSCKIFGDSFVKQFSFVKYDGYSENRNRQYQRSFDLFIPGKNLAIEVHGLLCHDLIANPDSVTTKIFDSIELGCRLLTIYEPWLIYAKKRNIIIAKLCHLLRKAKRKIHARDTLVVPTNDTSFIEEYHLFGYFSNRPTHIYYLISGGEPVASFSVKLFDNYVELHRLVFLPYVFIPGAVSKIISFIKQKYNRKIRSFLHAELCSNPLESVYSKIGMKFLQVIPTFHVFTPSGHLRHRLVISKPKLIQEAKERSIQFSEKDSQFELASKLGYHIVQSFVYDFWLD
jgi:hypothetical protein